MLLGNAHIEGARGHLLHHDIQRTAARHRWGNTQYLWIFLGKLHNRFTKHILVTRWRKLLYRNDFSKTGILVEYPWSMPQGLVGLSRLIPLPLFGDYMQQLGPGNILQVVEHLGKTHHIVTVYRTKISEVERLEKVALLKQGSLYTRLNFFNVSASNRPQLFEVRKHIPHILTQLVVRLRGGDIEQVLIKRPNVGIDSHVVVVKHNQQVGFLHPGVVQSLEGQAGRHRAITNNGHHLTLLVVELGGNGHT